MIVKTAIKDLNEKELRADLLKSQKGEEYKDEACGIKDYFKNLNLKDARTIFVKRSKMMRYVKMNFSNDKNYRKELWKCDSCQSAIDTQSHVLWCSAHSKIRENKSLTSDNDLAKYLQDVLEIRSKLNIEK